MELMKREELNKRLNLKTTQSKLIKIEELRILFNSLDTNPKALSAFLELMNERHERAEINSRQALKIIYKDWIISKLQKNILNFENSEILKLGQIIWDARLKKGNERKTELGKEGLVHKDDYNGLIEETTQAMDDISSKVEQQDKVLLFFRQKLGYQYNQIMAKYRNQLGN